MYNETHYSNVVIRICKRSVFKTFEICLLFCARKSTRLGLIPSPARGKAGNCV